MHIPAGMLFQFKVTGAEEVKYLLVPAGVDPKLALKILGIEGAKVELDQMR